jgi:hypothetical protein
MEIRLSARDQWEGPDSQPFFDKTFADSRITIGNDPAASLCLNGSVLSAEQIVIINGETGPELLNQAEGTYLNGEILPVNASRQLRDGDLLTIGTYRISIFLNNKPSTSNSNTDLQGDDGPVARENSASVAPSIDDTLEDFLERPQKQSNSSLPSNELTDDFLGATQPLKPSKSFGAILDSLRTDEDRFYFVIEGGSQSGVRVPIELEQMPLGWDETGEYLCFDISLIADLCSVIRKDWSGVILQAQTASGVKVNNEPLEDERRLRDGDRVLLRGPDKEATAGSEVVLVFREPTSLVILDSLMPRVSPLREDAAFPSEESGARGGARLDIHKPTQKLAELIKSDREYFSAFTFVDLSLMAIGTIIGAVIIFLILNYS